MQNSSGRTISAWMDTASIPVRPPLTSNHEADVCIIGAGITGLSVAYQLSRKGKRVIVLEDGTIGGGETERTTAHLSNVWDDRYMELERLHGGETAKLVAESHTAAINEIEHICTTERIDCDFTRLPGLLFLTPNDPPDLLENERDAAQRAGLIDVTMIDESPHPDASFGPYLLFPDQGQFHPLRYLRGLAKAVEHHGGIIHCGTHADSIEGGETARIKTSDGHTVRAQTVVVATNAPINDNAAIYSRNIPYRTYVIGLRVPQGSVALALYWDTGDPYHYVRLLRDDRSDDDILIVGGEDHKTGGHEETEKRYERLETWAREHFPAAGGIVYQWSGQVMEPTDTLAFIGHKPFDADNIFIATGDSGQGMTHGTIAGLLLCDLILGRDNPWSRVYDPRRGISNMKEFAKENVQSAQKFMTDRVAPPGPSSEEDLPLDSGTVVRDGRHEIALYRDATGTLQRLSAICPHRGCIVHWNDGEKTWDCPCHGSRFTATGTVVNGPANANLTSTE